MSKISCDVTKDLLASYLDGICSEESRGLVEEHLEECASCRQFIAQLKGQDLGKDAPKMNYLKKVRRSWLAGVLALGLIVISHEFLYVLSGNDVFYYIAMPIMMLLTVTMQMEGQKSFLPAKWEWIVPVLGLAPAGAIILLAFLTYQWVTEKLPCPWPMNMAGPHIEGWITFFAVLSAVLLVLSLVAVKGSRRVFVISQNIAWFGIHMGLVCNSVLYHMDSLESIGAVSVRNIIILAAEFVAVTALMLLGGRIGKFPGRIRHWK